ncbi:MAG: peptidoglycan-associated lipoprotein [Candidatus Rokuibacteriota bacterium]|nr:MAG: peptidoglycan-associated lipoprotein [Candidatus Rokubacteria bacterium]
MKSHRSHVACFAILAFLLSGCGTKTDEPTAMPTASAPADQPQRSPGQSSAPTPKPVAPSTPMAQSVNTPPPPVPVTVEEFTDEPALKDVFFDPGQNGIGRVGATVIRNNARWLVGNPGCLILIEGHSDPKGTRESNRAAGEQRAMAAATALVKQGVPGTRMWTVSHGSERPVCREMTDACAAKNRRVHFKIKKLQ